MLDGGVHVLEMIWMVSSRCQYHKIRPSRNCFVVSNLVQCCSKCRVWQVWIGGNADLHGSRYRCCMCGLHGSNVSRQIVRWVPYHGE